MHDARNELAVTQTVATLNYSFEGATRPQIINGEHERNVLYLTAADVPICDGAQAAMAPSLDREGFCRARVPADNLQDLNDVAAIARYRAQLKPLVMELTGADDVLMFPHVVTRRQSPQGEAEQAASPPILFVHSDYTPEGARQNEVVYGELPRPPRRTALLNMWKLLSPGPTDSPLALCDASSVQPEDVIAGESHYPKYGGFALETAFIKANPDHRWFYFSDLDDEEVLVFKQGDSDPRYPQIVPHSAFDNAANAPDAAPRISIECRCLAMWY